MRFIKFIVSLVITVALIYFLNSPQQLDEVNIPPLAKFFNPFGGFWQNAEDVEMPEYSGMTLKGLNDEVKIQFDEFLIPHIFAKNNHDLYLAQGYVVAQMRLWQMEFQTHAAAGRISELIGKKAIDFDRSQRRKGMVYGAQNSLEDMKKNADDFEFIEAYSDGVNQYISSLNYREYPLEYKLLDYSPEEWTPLKTALIQEYMIDNLTGSDYDLENTNALSLFGQKTFDFLFPDWLPGIDPVIPTATAWKFTPIPITEPETEFPILTTKSVIDMSDPDNGSNNWAVSGAKTKNGKPILANDMHLGLNLPSLWINMQLNSPDVNVMGFTFTGAPVIVQGFNDAVAWGFTNSPRDIRDWYNITFKDDSRNEYWYDSTWRKSDKVIEEIKIKNEESYYDTVVYTHHGPVVYDRNFKNEDSRKDYALKWIGHYPSRILTSINLLNRAKNYQDYKKAISYWDAPSQNIAFACTSGDIAITSQGKFPAKWKNQGKFLMNGALKEHEWQAYVPTEHNAFQHNPKRGYVSSANQHAVDSLYPYYFYDPGNEYYRNRRINRLLDSMTMITPEVFMHMHQDSYSIKAEEVLPLFLDSLNSDNLNESSLNLVKQLSEWDYQYLASSSVATIFDLWWVNFKQLLWDEFNRSDIPLIQPDDFNTTYIIKNYPYNEFIDIKSTSKQETLTDLINEAFARARIDLKKWKSEHEIPATWANFRNTGIIHLTRIPAFSINNVQSSGQRNTISAMKPNWGPSQRLIVELSNPPKAWSIFAGGQSGNPGSAYYDNMIKEWRDGKYISLNLMKGPESDDSSMLISYTLQPE